MTQKAIEALRKAAARFKLADCGQWADDCEEAAEALNSLRKRGWRPISEYKSELAVFYYPPIICKIHSSNNRAEHYSIEKWTGARKPTKFLPIAPPEKE